MNWWNAFGASFCGYSHFETLFLYIFYLFYFYYLSIYLYFLIYYVEKKTNKQINKKEIG